jgi:hypothetical protein
MGTNKATSHSGSVATTFPCKICTSRHRVEVEITLAMGRPVESIAKRISRGGETFSREDIQTHHDHLDLIQRALPEMEAARKRGVLLDLKTAVDRVSAKDRDRQLIRSLIGEALDQERPPGQGTGAGGRDTRP